MKAQTKKLKRKSGVPCGNAGEYFVMGELLSRGFDAQLADRNTPGYDMLVGRTERPTLRKVQVKATRGQSWYVKQASFDGLAANQVTVYVMLGSIERKKPVRFFIAKNGDLKNALDIPSEEWVTNAFLHIKDVQQYEDRWKTLLK